MFVPFVREYHSPQTPWEIYQRLHPGSEISFFLDSITYHPPRQNYSYMGRDPFLHITVKGKKMMIVEGAKRKKASAAQLFPVLRKLFKKYAFSGSSRFRFFTGGAVGYWGYDLVPLFEKVRFRHKAGPGSPRLFLGFYRDLIVYDHQKKIYHLVTLLSEKNSSSKKEMKKKARERLRLLEEIFNRALKRRMPDFHTERFRPDISRRQFERMVLRAKAYIAQGDIYQANLSQRFSFGFRGSALALYGALRKINPSPFASFLKVGDLEVISSSPERLVRKRGLFCDTRPIAGTRPRQMPGESEKGLQRDLLRSEKERAEHIMLVDLERNDLGRVCDWKSVRVASMMHVEKYSHVMHLVSEIRGRLKKNKDAFDLLKAMFPGGTITGCPKIRCMEIIDELEPVSRGIYTGSIGYIDFRQDLDLNIVIRTIVINENKGYFQVGAGIVYDSDPVREYEETLHKGEALAEALSKAST